MKSLYTCAGEVPVSFLHPHSPPAVFHYPNQPDILVIDCRNVLTAVNPTTATGQMYTLSKEETTAATQALAQRQSASDFQL